MTRNQRINIFNEALSEKGITPFHAIDETLVTELCEIIGSLHRLAETKGESSESIKAWIGASLPAYDVEQTQGSFNRTV